MVTEPAAGRFPAVREQVREFLADEIASGSFIPGCDQWIQGFSPEFSRKLGARGWLGMTWPTAYGGQQSSSLKRYAVVEELLAVGAPVAAHWFAERQTGPLLLAYGSEEQRRRYLPGIARGEVYVSIGMSEPGSGSDLASVQTRAIQTDGGWRVSGQKVWTSHAHRSHLIVALVRTSQERYEGLTQVMIPTDAPGVTINPITTISGEADFCEVFFEEVFVPHQDVIGKVGRGWEQVTSELAAERSGPERFLSVYPLVHAWIDECEPGPGSETSVGRVLASLWALRALSTSIVQQLDESSSSVAVEDISTVKDRGTVFEQDLVETLRGEVGGERWILDQSGRRMLDHAILSSPSFTLRGGTNEILRTLVARALKGPM